LRIEVLLTEPRWAALPATHPLAARDQIPFDQLWDEPFVAATAETGWWRDYWLATGERQGHPVRVGAVTDQPETWLTAIANGDGIALVPESAARYYARPGITYRPVTGVSPSQVGVAWPPANDTNPVVQDFVRCCLDNKPTAYLKNQLDRQQQPNPPRIPLIRLTAGLGGHSVVLTNRKVSY
jgi:DNA-binding transcriptional LysR family regulator